jgi:hypothetical protein
MKNWRQILSWRTANPEGYEEGDPPYSQDADFDPDGNIHKYRVPYSESVYGHFFVEGRCIREARERYESGLEEGYGHDSDDTNNWQPYFESIRDEGREN